MKLEKTKFGKEKKNTKKDKQLGTNKLSLKVVLLMLSIIPLVVCAVITSVILVVQSRKLIDQTTTNSLYSLAINKGEGIQAGIESSEEVLKGFASSAEVRNLLLNPDDPKAIETAQSYTLNYYDKLEGWDGLYIADWQTKVLTHPVEAVIGKVMREGDKLTSLQNAMLSCDGVYNVGIMVSPASGKYVVSLYVPVFDDSGNPIGYVGGGSYAETIISKYSDVSSMGIASAYSYVVAPDGNFVTHPKEEKIGTPVTNDVIKAVYERMLAGEHPEPECVTYFNEYIKYAGYYVAPDNGFIFVITGDKNDVMAGSKHMVVIATVVTLVLIVLSAVIAMIIAIRIANPINDVSKKCHNFASGDLNVAFAKKSPIHEIQLLLDNLNLLKQKVSDVVYDIQQATEELVNNSMDLKNAVETSVESVSQISEAINDVAQGNTDLASNVSTQMASVQELGANIDESNDEIIHMSDITSATVELSKQASILMSELIDLTNITKTNIDSISAQSEKNVRAAEEINQITEAISDITSQTNLLSLNASIEAARAGEAGRGFSVVASEIRNLADNSANQTNNIKEIIQKLLETINETNQISDNLVTSAFTQLEKLDITRDMFNKVISQVSDIGDNTSSVSSNMGNITEIKNSVTDIAENLSAVSQQTSASSEEVAASAQLVNESINSLSTVVVNLENMANRLQESASYFK